MTSQNKRIDLVEIGILSKPHGLNGEIKLMLHSQDSDLILKIKEVFIEDKPLKISKVKKVSNGILIKFNSRNDRTSIEKLLKKKVFVDKNIIPNPPEGENYFFELIGINFNSSTSSFLKPILINSFLISNT